MCNCIIEQEQKTLELFRRQQPNSEVSVNINTIIYNNKPIIPILLKVTEPIDKVKSNKENVTNYLIPKYCAFCGEKI